MKTTTRFTLAQRLEPLGLRTTLIAVKRDGRYAVSRIDAIASNVELTSIGEFMVDNPPCIGRVGMPDPLLGAVPWQRSMTFHGKWFDQIATSDTGLRFYQQVPSIAHEKMLSQIGRDDQYAVIGSYYSMFRAIMDAKRHVPLVLIDDAVLSRMSFPVLLPVLRDMKLEQRLLDILRMMLRRYPSDPEGREGGGSAIDGMDVEEI